MAEAGLTRLRVPTTSLGDGCSSVCRPCVGLHGNGQPAPPGRTPRMPSASTMSDWPVTWTALLNADDAAASREWCWCCCCWWRCCNVDGKNTPPTPIPTGYRPAINDDIRPNLKMQDSMTLFGDWCGWNLNGKCFENLSQTFVVFYLLHHLGGRVDRYVILDSVKPINFIFL